MMLRRVAFCLAAAGVTVGAAGVVPWSGRAAAAGLQPPPPTGVVTAPKPDETASGTSGTIHITWSDDNGTSLKIGSTATVNWKRDGKPPKGAVGPATSSATAPADSCGTDGWHCSYGWPFFQGRYVPNGTYTITATATACSNINVCSAPGAASTAQPFTVSNVPVVPKNVVATLKTSPTQVKISWDANPEPDVLGYAIYRVQDSTPQKDPFFACSVGV